MRWALGIDIGGTKTDVAAVDESGKILERKKFPTQVAKGIDAIQKNIIAAALEIKDSVGKNADGVGVGMAGQILPGTGIVKFAPNLGWHNVPLQSNLHNSLNMPVYVTNDVRAATWGEWRHGSGKNCQDFICLFIGTGIGGGIVSQGQIMTGASNSAGELGHTVIKMNGNPCSCGNRGCLEAFAGGWAVAKQAKAAVQEDPKKGAVLLQLVSGQIEMIAAYHVLEAAKQGDPLAGQIVEDTIEAISIGCSSFVNAFNPARLILGGGLGMALPHLIEKVEKGVRKCALLSATEDLEILPASLGNDAGVIGAATLALQ